MKFTAVGAALLAIPLTSALIAQQRPQPNTEVYLSSLGRDVSPIAGNREVINISNNPGYDNQPSFTPDGKAVLFTSNRDGKQTDIYRYDIASKQATQVTHTPESEYSPVVTPDGKTFSVIRVEADGTQRLWRFDLDGSNPRRVMTNVTGVGYQAWLDATHVAVFIVGANGQPNTLQIADTAADTSAMVDSNPGHGLALRPAGRGGAAPTLTYVCKTDPKHWVVKEVSLTDTAPKVLIDAVEGSEDLAWDPAYGNQRLLMTAGTKMMVAFFTGATPTWREAGDFTTAGVAKLTRLAIARSGTPNLAFVAEPVAK